MKLIQVAAALIAVTVIGISSAVAAPVESMESGRAVALAKVDGFLAEKAVADQLKSLGLTSQQVSSRLALLSDTQINQLAAQVDQIRAAGDVETDPTRFGVVDSFFKQIGTFFYNVFQLVFFWRDLK